MSCLVQVLNPRYRKLPGDFRARQTAWEGPREGAGLSSFANSEQEIGPVVKHLGEWPGGSHLSSNSGSTIS